MTDQLTFYTDSAEGWERSLMAFLAEKERRSDRCRLSGGCVILEAHCGEAEVAVPADGNGGRW